MLSTRSKFKFYDIAQASQSLKLERSLTDPRRSANVLLVEVGKLVALGATPLEQTLAEFLAGTTRVEVPPMASLYLQSLGW